MLTFNLSLSYLLIITGASGTLPVAHARRNCSVSAVQSAYIQWRRRLSLSAANRYWHCGTLYPPPRDTGGNRPGPLSARVALVAFVPSDEIGPSCAVQSWLNTEKPAFSQKYTQTDQHTFNTLAFYSANKLIHSAFLIYQYWQQFLFEVSLPLSKANTACPPYIHIFFIYRVAVTLPKPATVVYTSIAPSPTQSEPALCG